MEKIKALLVGLSKIELQSLNMTVVNAIREHAVRERKEWIAKFTLGETVSFVTQNKMFKGETIVGTLVNLTPQIAGVQSDKVHGFWSVSPMKLQKVS